MRRSQVESQNGLPGKSRQQPRIGLHEIPFASRPLRADGPIRVLALGRARRPGRGFLQRQADPRRDPRDAGRQLRSLFAAPHPPHGALHSRAIRPRCRSTCRAAAGSPRSTTWPTCTRGRHRAHHGDADLSARAGARPQRQAQGRHAPAQLDRQHERRQQLPADLARLADADDRRRQAPRDHHRRAVASPTPRPGSRWSPTARSARSSSSCPATPAGPT